MEMVVRIEIWDSYCKLVAVAMMSSRNVRESLFGPRNIAVGSQQHHRRGQSLVGVYKESDENLDLFSKSRRTLSVASSDESSDVSVKLGRLSVGSAKVARNGIDDLLSSTDGGKHDYDWLLTPPGTPVFPSTEGESQPSLQPPRGSSLVRSTSTAKASRLSVSQSENNHSRPARSSSVSRSSISNSQYSTYTSNRSSSILNTSSASVSSYIRPSSPITRSSSAARPSTPSSRPTLSRPSTPSRARPVAASTAFDRSRPSQSSRPSTPNSRPQIPANLHSQAAPPARSFSRPSTPTRRTPVPSSSPSPGSSTSAGRVTTNGRNSAPSSRPSSPLPRVRPPPQPVVPPDFPLDTPPNLRTTLPDRPVSAGRSRPGVALSMKGNSESQASTNMPRRHSSPIVTRGRSAEPTGRGRIHANGHFADAPDARKVSHAPELAMRKPVKASTTATDSTGFGRTISKKSLDMAIRHMDIRNSSGNIRSLSSTTLFPQSVRNSTLKTQSARGLSALASVDMNSSPQRSNNGVVVDNGDNINRIAINGTERDEGRYSAKLSEADIFESSRYDAILLKEDLKNTNWLHSADEKCDEGPIFDNGFESLPEPFGLL
ncbi:mucin-17 isoform X1 [Quillaja saponaria]|uniref:Mucin-17 isoform X1 n=1 Tax=Quillaja saponaria TaxID=32244 RepID=A0AAD7LNB2_QUISA|nr:mucin-17 isoform X1 [Quillaja saponaria]